MSETVNVAIDASGLGAGVEEAAAQVERAVAERIVPAALLIEDAFTLAGRSIQSSLARAAQSGTLSLDKLTRALTRDLGRFAIDALVRRPVQGLVSGLLSAPFGGARAAGGFAAAGQSFLVGERGPELFTPAGSGMVSPLSGGPGGLGALGALGALGGARRGGGLTVNISLPGVTDADSFQRSSTQIAAALARAVGRGQRNL